MIDAMRFVYKEQILIHKLITQIINLCHWHFDFVTGNAEKTPELN